MNNNYHNFNKLRAGLFIITAWILSIFPGKAQVSTSDSLALLNIANTNFSGTTALNWLVDSNPHNWIGVTWDTSVVPNRVTELILANDATSGNGKTSAAGLYCASIAPLIYPDPEVNHYNWSNPGVTTDLQGEMDFTPFSELKVLAVALNPGITKIKLDNLNKLEQLMCGKTDIDTLIASGLDSLKQVKYSGNNYSGLSGHKSRLKYIDVSNCPNLLRLQARWDMDSLDYVDISGCTKLLKVSLKQNRLKQLKMDGVSSLVKLSVSTLSPEAQLDSLPSALQNNSNMKALGVAGVGLKGTLDISALIKLEKIGFGRNSIDSLNGFFTDTNLVRIGGYENRLDLTEATTHSNNTTPTDTNQAVFLRQTTDGASVYHDDSLDFSAHQSIDVNGTPTTSFFGLYDFNNTLIRTAPDGIYRFNTTDIGPYYLRMRNSGGSVISDTIFVLKYGPEISVSISNTNFGTIMIGDTVFQTITVYNNGDENLNIDNITLPSGYSIANSTATIAPTDSAQFTVLFTPVTVGVYNGNIVVSNDAISGDSIISNITGSGISLPVLDVQTPITDFGNIFIGTDSSETFTINNNGTADLIISAITAPTDFNVNPASATIPAGDSVQVTITFSPAMIQSYSGSIVINHNDLLSDPSGIDSFNVTGTGLATPVIQAKIDNFDFDTVIIGQLSIQTLTIYNEGSADLIVSDISVPAAYSISATTGTIPAGDSTKYSVTFEPTMANEFSGLIEVTHNDQSGTGTDTIFITGVGKDLTGGIAELHPKQSFFIFPNPSSDYVMIECNNQQQKNLNVMIIDVLGNQVQTVSIRKNESVRVNLSDFEQGVYFLQTNDGLSRGRFIKY